MPNTPRSMNEIIILLLIGLFAGVFSGFIGLGGGVIIVPALVYFLSIQQHTAQGTTLAMMLLPIQLLAVINYHRSGYVDFKMAAVIATTFIVGSYFGSKYAVSLPGDTIKKIFGVFILIIGLKMIFGK